LEVIEAHWLFGVPSEQIETVIHPQSIIHSMVQFRDGSIKSQMGLPDMRFPIHYALNFPQRIQNSFPRYDFNTINTLTFEKPDTERFPCLRIAYDALKIGGNVPCIVNAANETVVNAFLKQQIKFMQIPQIIEKTISRCYKVAEPNLDTYIESDMEARLVCEQIINTL
jgi:1-deoxy-D-xylulose-5-phosphate reductoisomerase